MLASRRHNNDHAPTPRRIALPRLRNRTDPLHDHELRRLLRLGDLEVSRRHGSQCLWNEGKPLHQLPRQSNLRGRLVQNGCGDGLQLEQLQRVLRQQRKLLLWHEQRRLRARRGELHHLHRATELSVDNGDRRVLRLTHAGRSETVNTPCRTNLCSSLSASTSFCPDASTIADTSSPAFA